jgi:hypothetical protein
VSSDNRRCTLPPIGVLIHRVLPRQLGVVRMITIRSPHKKRTENSIRIHFPVEFGEMQRTLWYEVDEKYVDLVSERLDAAVVALLIPAMSYGGTLFLDGNVSHRLIYNLQNSVQIVFQKLIPSTHLLKIKAKKIDMSNDRQNGVATGFSAGVDSFSVLNDHFFQKTVSGYQLTHLLFNNVGSHGDHAPLRFFNDRFSRIKRMAAEIGLPCIKVNSNLHDFYPKWMSFRQTHTPRNMSVGLLLQKGIGRWLYASSYQHEQQHVAPSDDSAYADMVTLPLLSTDTFDAFSAGGEYSRVEKTLQIVDNPFAQRYLDVCALRSDTNCSHCWKCLRTLLTLEIAGKIDKFSEVFDLDVYEQRRIFYISRVLRSREALPREIVAFAQQKDFRFPRKSRLLPPIAFLPQEFIWKLRKR